MTTKGLAVSGVVNVTVNIAPIAVGYLSFGTALLLGSSDVIDTGERVRMYRTIDQVANEFGTTATEYVAAALHFAQQPRPSVCYIGRWGQTVAPAVLHGGALPTTDQDIPTWNAITTGSMSITANGTPVPMTNMNFAGASNMNAVATIIDTAFTAGTVTWDANYQRFDVKTTTTGPTATLSYATPQGTGVDISSKTGLTSTKASVPVNGTAIETALAAAQACANASGDWYSLAYVTPTMPTDNELIDVAAYIEGSARMRIIAITDQNVQALDPLIVTDIGSRLKTLRYKRSFVQFSRSNKYAAVSMAARILTTDWEAENTAITLKFKQEPGVAAEILTQTQANALRNKNVNSYDQYDNDSVIIEEGKMANGYFVDEVVGLDWLANAVQVDTWNVLYQALTKIPQTDAGMTQLTTAVEGAMARGVRNGLLAAGLWTGPPLGALKTGQALTKGYYVYCPLVASQPQALREARRAPTIQVAAKLAGAVHFVDVLINVNR